MKRGQTAGQQDERAEPERVRAGFERRPVADEVAIALGQKRENLVVAPPLLHLGANLAPQIDGEIRLRVGEGFVLADEAPELLTEEGQPFLERGMSRGGRGERKTGQDDADRQQPHHCPYVHRLSLATSGSTVCSSTSTLSAPICL